MLYAELNLHIFYFLSPDKNSSILFTMVKNKSDPTDQQTNKIGKTKYSAEFPIVNPVKMFFIIYFYSLLNHL